MLDARVKEAVGFFHKHFGKRRVKVYNKLERLPFGAVIKPLMFRKKICFVILCNLELPCWYLVPFNGRNKQSRKGKYNFMWKQKC